MIKLITILGIPNLLEIIEIAISSGLKLIILYKSKALLIL